MQHGSFIHVHGAHARQGAHALGMRAHAAAYGLHAACRHNFNTRRSAHLAHPPQLRRHALALALGVRRCRRLRGCGACAGAGSACVPGLSGARDSQPALAKQRRSAARLPLRRLHLAPIAPLADSGSPHARCTPLSCGPRARGTAPASTGGASPARGAPQAAAARSAARRGPHVCCTRWAPGGRRGEPWWGHWRVRQRLDQIIVFWRVPAALATCVEEAADAVCCRCMPVPHRWGLYK